MPNTNLATRPASLSPSLSQSLSPSPSPLPSVLEVDLRPGLGAGSIDGHLKRAARGRDFSNRILAFYFDELHESGKFQDLGYTCLAQYADQRLGFDPRRARELCQAGRALVTLTRIDQACRDGLLCWTKTELLTHGVQEHQQDEWIERAQRVSCTEFRRMLQRHRRGLSVEKTRAGGLPRSEFDIEATFSAGLYAKIEEVREGLMRRRGEFVDDSEVLGYIVQEHVLPERNVEREVEREAERAAACEQDETPDWLRRKVLARDGHRCQACGKTGLLHAHHIVFRSRGGLTREDNLVTACVLCHGLIHEGRLFARGRATAGVEFQNRFGEPLLAAGRPVAALPQPVLRILGGDGSLGRDEGGGQPPRGSGCASQTGIPDDITGEWFKAHMHLFESGRDGVWRLAKSARSTGESVHQP